MAWCAAHNAVGAGLACGEHVDPFNPGYNMGPRGPEIVNNPSRGQLPGYGQAAGYGAHGQGTYDARLMELVLKVRF